MQSVRHILTSVTLCALLACRGATDIELQPANPRLEDLRFTVEEPKSNQALELIADLAPGEEMSDSEFILITLSSSDGKKMEVLMTLEDYCRADQAPIVCDRLIVTLYQGRSVDELDGLLQELDAQFVLFWLSPIGQAASIQIFSGHLHNARERLAAHPAIRIAEFNHIYFLGPDAPAQETLRAMIRRGHSAITGGVSVSPGDHVSATYTQPDGSVLRAVANVQ